MLFFFDKVVSVAMMLIKVVAVRTFREICDFLSARNVDATSVETRQSPRKVLSASVKWVLTEKGLW